MKNEDNVIAVFRKSLLGLDMEEEDVRRFFALGHVRLLDFSCGGIVFHYGDMPKQLYMLLSGSVRIQKDSFSGRNIMLSELDETGDVFGEVYLLLEKPYDIYVEARANTMLLSVGNEVFLSPQLDDLKPCRLLRKNLMRVLARKAYFMHNKLKVLASGSLRERIVRFLFWEIDKDGAATLPFNRETWARYLSVARPSLSRELGAMGREGIIAVDGRTIRVIDRKRFEEYL